MGLRYPHRQRLRYIEPKPKEFRWVGDTLDIKIPNLAPETKADLLALRSIIERGEILPDRYYRPSMNRRGDTLLVDRGVLHLHLAAPDDDALVYLIQYPDHVIFVCLDTHKHLKAIPPGANLSDAAIMRAEKELLDELGLDPRFVPDDEDEDDDGEGE